MKKCKPNNKLKSPPPPLPGREIMLCKFLSSFFLIKKPHALQFCDDPICREFELPILAILFMATFLYSLNLFFKKP
jgi:hypothetical protein